MDSPWMVHVWCMEQRWVPWSINSPHATESWTISEVFANVYGKTNEFVHELALH